MTVKNKKLRSVRNVLIILFAVILMCIVINAISFIPGKPVQTLSETKVETADNFKYEVTTINVYNGNNKIVGQMYKPEGDGLFPLLIYSHGFAFNQPEYSMEKLVQNGIAACHFDFCGGSTDSLSDGDSLDMSVKTEADDLKAVLDELKQLDYIDRDRIYLSGHSQGGFVSTMVGAERADEIRGMFLLSPAYFINDLGVYALFLPENIDMGTMTISKKYYKDASDYKLFKEMKKFEGKVIIYHGTADDMAPIRYSRKALNHFPDAELYTVEGANHDFSSYEAERIQSDIIRRILEDTPKPQT